MDRHAVLPSAHSEPCRYSFKRQKSASCARARASYAAPRCARPRRQNLTGKVLPVAQELRGHARNVAGQPSPVCGGDARQLLRRAHCAALAPPGVQGALWLPSRHCPGVALELAHRYRFCGGARAVATGGVHVAHRATTAAVTHAAGARLYVCAPR